MPVQPPTPTYGLLLEGDQIKVSTTTQTTFFDPRFLVAALLDHVARGASLGVPAVFCATG